jgi:2-oxoglutarate dehydrogenase E2 component (dihydrolipoamide succinyltransferase)
MISRRILVASRLLRYPFPFQQFRSYADRIVKVPDIAESILEGTLKQWLKKVSDYVEQDEEIATIETDKIDVVVNAPEAGTIRELLANKENTMTVRQDLVKLELRGSSRGAKRESTLSKPKGLALSDQSTSLEPKLSKKDNSALAPIAEEKKLKPLVQDQPKKESLLLTQTELKTKPKLSSSMPALRNRKERYVKMNQMRLRIAKRLK